MGTIRVYRYELYDRPSRGFIRQPHYATEKAIVLLQGVVMYSTAKDVPESEIDALGTSLAGVVAHAG